MSNTVGDKNLHSGHRKRVKESVSENGFSHLRDHQLLELLLFYAIPRADTNDLAHRLLAEFKTFDALLKADVEALKRVEGVGESTALLIAAAGEMFVRAQKVDFSKNRLYKTPEDFKLLAINELQNQSVEKIFIFCLDSAGKLKKTVEISSGDEMSAELNMRKAVQAVVDCNAPKAFVAHNHPSGICEPSISDIDVTRNLCVMFRKLGFLLVDHVIVGANGEAFSMYSSRDFQQMFY